MDSILARLGLEAEEKALWKQYLELVAHMGASSEASFYKIFSWPFAAEESIEWLVGEGRLRMPICFAFGDVDWMNSDGAKRLARSKRNVQVRVVPQAGHQLIFNNPKAVAALIDDFVFQLKKPSA